MTTSSAKVLLQSFVDHMENGNAQKARTCLRKLRHRHGFDVTCDSLEDTVKLTRYVWTTDPHLASLQGVLMDYRGMMLVKVDVTLSQLTVLKNDKHTFRCSPSFEVASNLPRQERENAYYHRQRQLARQAGYYY
tara:strand:- start:102 stop:503 length:402 start_codon:yes stop_codon:yes gene_type:complete